MIMPFKKVASGKYKSPSGRTFTAAQVRLYYANGGKFPGEKKGKTKGRRRKLGPNLSRSR